MDSAAPTIPLPIHISLPTLTRETYPKNSITLQQSHPDLSLSTRLVVNPQPPPPSPQEPTHTNQYQHQPFTDQLFPPPCPTPPSFPCPSQPCHTLPSPSIHPNHQRFSVEHNLLHHHAYTRHQPSPSCPTIPASPLHTKTLPHCPTYPQNHPSTIASHKPHDHTTIHLSVRVAGEVHLMRQGKGKQKSPDAYTGKKRKMGCSAGADQAQSKEKWQRRSLYSDGLSHTVPLLKWRHVGDRGSKDGGSAESTGALPILLKQQSNGSGGCPSTATQNQ